MIEMLREALIWGCLLGGSAFAVVGGVGLLRLPDCFSRMHGAGITDTAGAGLILAGLMLDAGFHLATAKLAFVLLLLLVTSPTATHALARSALSHGVRPHTAPGEEGPSST